MAIHGCALLSGRLPLGHNDAFRLASTLAFLIGTGLHFLRLTAASGFDAEARQTVTLHILSRQLVAASSVVQRAVDPQRQPQAAAAFVRTAGRPEAVVPWLLDLGQALLALPFSYASGKIPHVSYNKHKADINPCNLI